MIPTIHIKNNIIRVLSKNVGTDLTTLQIKLGIKKQLIRKILLVLIRHGEVYQVNEYYYLI